MNQTKSALSNLSQTSQVDSSRSEMNQQAESTRTDLNRSYWVCQVLSKVRKIQKIGKHCSSMSLSLTATVFGYMCDVFIYINPPHGFVLLTQWTNNRHLNYYRIARLKWCRKRRRRSGCSIGGGGLLFMIGSTIVWLKDWEWLTTPARHKTMMRSMVGIWPSVIDRGNICTQTPINNLHISWLELVDV